MSEKPTYEELEMRNRELEKRLRIASSAKNQNHYRKIFDCSPFIVYTKDLEGHYTSINKQFENLSGLKSKEVIGKTDYELFPPQVAENSTKNDKQIIQAGTPKEFEEYGPADGKMYTFISTKYPLMDEGGKIYGIVGLSSDIIESANVAQALREKDKLFRTAIKHSPIAIVVSEGIDQAVIMVNDRFTDLFGYTKEDVPDVATWWVLAYPDKAYREKIRIRWTKAVEKSFSGQSHVEPMEVTIACKDGTLKEVSVEAATVGEVNLVAFVDMTERKRMEEELRESEEKYRILFENTGEALFVAQDGRIVFHNPRNVELTGYSTEELQSRPFIEFIHEDDRKMVTERHLRRIRGENPPARYAFRIIHKSGPIRWVELNAVMIQWSGKPSTLCFITDITDRKQTENKLIEKESQLRQIIDLVPHFIFVKDEMGKFEIVNKATAELFGTTVEDLTGRSESEFVLNEDEMEHLRSDDLEVIKSGKTKFIPEESLTDSENNIRYLQTTKVPFKFSATKKPSLLGVSVDITERKLAEEALSENEKTLNITGQMAKIGGWELYPETMKVTWTDETYRIHELPKTFKPPLEDAINFWHPEDQPILRKAIQKALDDGIPYDLELRFITAKGKNLYARTRCNPVLHNGKVVKLQGFFHDITERKQAEEEKEKLQAQLSQAQKMEAIGRLAGGVAHDFNNMLGVILGHTELALLQADENHDLYDDLKEIQTAAMRSADITKQLLAFARKQTISPKKLDLNDTVESMLKMLRRLIGEDIDLVWQPGVHLWPVKMDPSQIDQILANLCINARDAISGAGKLTIETGKKTFDEKYCKDNPGFIPGDFSMLAVSDNGCGMDKTTLQNLFEPFYTTKDVGKGTGLGLSTVYGIVKQNNGFINVYSEPGRGSTFKIYLSRLVVNENIDKVVPDKKATAGGTETILLVEDEPSILRMTRMMLERKGYTVLTATTPADAMKKAKNHSDSIDLLMTDVVMPGMNGRDLAGQISTLFPDIGLLFMSGYTADVIAHQGVLDAGVAFIQKPFSLADMTEKVREVLDNASDNS